MTGMAPYQTLNVPHPVFVAVEAAGPSLAWLKPIVNVGAITGLASAAFATLYAQSRIFYSMARDGMLPPVFATLHPKHRTPSKGSWYTGWIAAIIAGCVPIDVLGELVSIGTLFAFAIVCIGVLLLRYREPDIPRAFRAPALGLFSTLGTLICVYLMFSLPNGTWIRLAVWLAIGLGIYFGYGYRHSQLQPERTPS
jgi:APA family basic amino acid/polyamine antiporter